MKLSKETKRISLFPKYSKPFSQDQLMIYIEPLVKEKFIPFMNKGLFFNIENNSISNLEEDWNVSFKSSFKESISVSVTSERIDIKEDSLRPWSDFLQRTASIMNIIRENNPSGFNRIAVGNVFYGSVSQEALPRFFPQCVAQELNDSVTERMFRTVKTETFEVRTPDPQFLKINNVVSQTINRKQDEWFFIMDLDINTIVGSDSKLVSLGVDAFIDFYSKVFSSYKNAEFNE